jgi:hypothetical protein
MPRVPLASVIQRHAPALLAREGVVGLYESVLEDGSACLVLAIDRDPTFLPDPPPDLLEGYPVVVQVTGRIDPQ